MRFVMLSVRDACAGVFGTPHFSVSRPAGVRSFSDEVNRADPQNILWNHPEHFELFEVGIFDDQDGNFEIYSKPVSVCLALNVCQKAVAPGGERPGRTSPAGVNGGALPSDFEVRGV